MWLQIELRSYFTYIQNTTRARSKSAASAHSPRLLHCSAPCLLGWVLCLLLHSRSQMRCQLRCCLVARSHFKRIVLICNVVGSGRHVDHDSLAAIHSELCIRQLVPRNAERVALQIDRNHAGACVAVDTSVQLAMCTASALARQTMRRYCRWRCTVKLPVEPITMQ